jgi:5-methylcytosine-specific restriction endonuclease McrA
MNRSCIDCGRIIPATQTRCAAHEAAYRAQRQHQKGLYSSPSWRALRASVLQRGHCEDCGGKEADQVHHRFAVRDGNPLICPPAHLLLLCKACHLRRERGHVEPTLSGGYTAGKERGPVKATSSEDARQDDHPPFVL